MDEPDKRPHLRVVDGGKTGEAGGKKRKKKDDPGPPPQIPYDPDYEAAISCPMGSDEEDEHVEMDSHAYQFDPDEFCAERETAPELPQRVLWKPWKRPNLDRDLYKIANHIQHHIDEMIPPESFFTHFLRYMEPLHTREAHNWGTAVALLAACMRSRWVMQWTENRPIKASVGVLLLGNSGVGKSIIRAGFAGLLPPQVTWNEKIYRSDQAFLQVFGAGGGEKDASTLFWWVADGRSLFHKLYDPTHVNLAAYLIQAIDGDVIDATRTNKGGQQDIDRVENPCLTMLIANTVDGIIPPNKGRGTIVDLFKGGFISRFIVAPGFRDEPEDIVTPRGARYTKFLKDRLLATASVVPDAAPTWDLRLHPDALKELRTWNGQLGKSPDPCLDGVWHRAKLIAAKLAMIYHAAQSNHPTMLISADNTVRAILAVQDIILPSHFQIVKTACASQFQSHAQTLLATLARLPGGLRVNEVGLELGVPPWVRDDVLAALHRHLEYSTWCTDSPSGGVKKGRPHVVVGLRGRDLVRTGETIKTARVSPPTGVNKSLQSASSSGGSDDDDDDIMGS